MPKGHPKTPRPPCTLCGRRPRLKLVRYCFDCCAKVSYEGRKSQVRLCGDMHGEITGREPVPRKRAER
jgi:hypothetical protein